MVRVGFGVTAFVGTIVGFGNVIVGLFEFPLDIVVGSPVLSVGVVCWSVGVVVTDRVASPAEEASVGSTVTE